MTEEKLAELSIFNGAIQKYKELCSLIKLINTRNKPKYILEIGTDKGGTLWLWCQLADIDAKIISIDLPGGNFSSRYTAFQMIKLQNYKLFNQQLFFIREDSHNIITEEKLIKILNNNKIDLLFIDGDHTLDGVKDDYYRYEKYVNKNGLIIFHDIIYHNKVHECQVQVFWNYIKTKYESYEFVDNETDDRGWGNWGGIGVLIKQY